MSTAHTHTTSSSSGNVAELNYFFHLLNNLIYRQLNAPATATRCLKSKWVQQGASTTTGCAVCTYKVTGECSRLSDKALEHMPKKAAPQGPTPNSTKNRMVS
jgi:hypothetical protein